MAVVMLRLVLVVLLWLPFFVGLWIVLMCSYTLPVKGTEMDPNEAARIMRDESLPLDERVEAADDLLDWLNAGGCPQSMFMSDGSRRTFGGNTAAKLAAKDEVLKYLGQFQDIINAGGYDALGRVVS